ncbi:hypothetical protein MHTCC0001_01440 [Flavobacteriaceae bacterium MHTCC 0001]
MKTNLKFLVVVFLLFSFKQVKAQSVNVDVNLNIKHSVGGVSDFGRDRHITLHASLSESDWDGEHEKMTYLLNELDVYLGRDNGSASWKFAATPVDPDRPNKADISFIEPFADWWDGQYEDIIKERTQFKDHANAMIMGTNPHPTYPTLSYWHPSGPEGSQWIPQDIETSAEWMVEYLDKSFTSTFEERGELMPKYWEVINEPDMLLNTGAFMVSSWEDIWEYHNLVATGVKNRLGNRAPKIGGMTWGLHDFFSDDLHRSRQVGYSDAYYGNTPADEIAKAYARSQTESAYLNVTGPWTQWDVLWRGFMDHAGDNMDFYSVHIYDWPKYNANGGTIRSGGHTEAMLEMIEWYDIHENGVANRKPLIISEYGSVQGSWNFLAHSRRYDWEVIKPFSSMLMQFLERPDYVELSMPFTPVKATWGDVDTNGDGTAEYFYHYKMLRDDDGDGNWEWSDYIKWFQLWSEINGTRIDTKSTDADIQVDSYIDGDTVYLIINNLDSEATNINLNFFGNTSNTLENVTIKHLFLQGEDDVTLSQNLVTEAPSSILLAADATMVLKYKYTNPVTIDETSDEKKYYGQSVGGGDLHRIDISGGDQIFQVNGVSVPDKGEAMLKITGAFFDSDQTPTGFLSIPKFQVNGTTVEAPYDWRGENQLRSRYFGTFEIPVPIDLLQENNTFTVDFKHAGQVTVVNLVVWDFSVDPGRTTDVVNPSDVAVTGISVLPATATVEKDALLLLSTNLTPTNATNKLVTWSSSNESIATVDSSGSVTGISTGEAIITATTEDGSFSASSTITIVVTPKPVTGVEVTPETLELTEGESSSLTANVLPSYATDKSVTWGSSDSNIATVNSEGLVTAINSGSATITATTNDGAFTDSSTITILEPRQKTGNTLIVEAENLDTMGGTYADGNGGGVGITGVGINFVNTGDWATYSFNVPEDADYEIAYFISTPSDGAQIRILIDDVEISVDNVVNNGQWDNYQELVADNHVTLTSGIHTIRIEASSATAWQWNLDKIVFSELQSLYINNFLVDGKFVYPVPAREILNVDLGTVSEKVTVSLVNIYGVTVKQREYKSKFQFDVSNLSKGIYFVTVGSNSGLFTKKIVIE